MGQVTSKAFACSRLFS